MRLNTFLMLLVLASVSLAACQSNPSPDGKPLANMTFSHLQPLRLNAASVEVQNQSQPTGNIAEGFLVPLDEMVRAYVQRRLIAGGGDPSVNVMIEKIAVTHERKASKNSIANYLDLAYQDQYKVDIGLHLNMRDPLTGSERGRRFSVQRSMNISEHVSVAEREKRQMEGLEEMFRQIDQTVVDIVKNDFGIVAFGL